MFILFITWQEYQDLRHGWGWRCWETPNLDQMCSYLLRPVRLVWVLASWLRSVVVGSSEALGLMKRYLPSLSSFYFLPYFNYWLPHFTFISSYLQWNHMRSLIKRPLHRPWMRKKRDKQRTIQYFNTNIYQLHLFFLLSYLFLFPIPGPPCIICECDGACYYS